MAPDPQGTSPAGSAGVGMLGPAGDLSIKPYDRSSLRGDFLVLIPDQTEEEYLRRRPDDRRSEFVDGTVYLHPTEADRLDPAEFYNRHSLSGNFLVLIPDQTGEEFRRKAPRYPLREFIDGMVCIHASPSCKHQFDVQFVLVPLAMFNSVREVGTVLVAPAALRLRPGSELQPDTFVLPPGIIHSIDVLQVHPPALLIVEVLSPTTRKYDLTEKLELYREADDAEVWFIDARDRVVLIDRRGAEGRVSSRVASGPLASTGAPGFWIDVDWLWADPRPKLMWCLDQITAGPPA